MQRLYGILFCCIVTALLGGCTKDNAVLDVPANSISIQGLSSADTLGMSMEIMEDSVIVIGLKAVCAEAVSSGNLLVGFGVDTSKIAGYRAKYGDARLLPATSYYFYKPDCRISAGDTLSDSAKLNIILQTRLRAYSTYVLPLTIQSVNVQSDAIASNEVLYLVIRTGKAAFISKDGWSIVSVSTQETSNPATNVLDYDDVATYWESVLFEPMPQYITIDFGEQLAFSGVTFCLPTLYARTGYGCPTSVQIDLSDDGTNWTNTQTFSPQFVNTTQVINTGIAEARYLRFTVLASKPLIGISFVVIGGIGLQP